MSFFRAEIVCRSVLLKIPWRMLPPIIRASGKCDKVTGKSSEKPMEKLKWRY